MGRSFKLWCIAGSLIVLAAAVASPPAHADRLSNAEIFIEINDTDGDAGIQILLDAEGWERMQVVDPDGNVLLDLTPKNSARIQGMTEAFFESAEPSFDEQPLDEFLALWPPGFYKFRGRTNDDPPVPLRGRARLTHALPGAPLLILPIQGDDEVDPEDTVVQWLPVADPPGSEIVRYEVIVQTDDDDAPKRTFSATVNADVTSIEVPPSFMLPGTDYKFEVLAKEASGNQTLSEGEFATAEEDE